MRNHFQTTATATTANTHGIHNSLISSQTVRNRLHEGRLIARRPYVGCVLARRHLVNRVNWARRHQRWLRQQWNSEFFFSDESRFTIYRGDCRRNECYADCCILERDRLGLGKHCT